MRVEHRHRVQDRERLLGRRQHFRAESLSEQVGRSEIASKVIEDAGEPVRPVLDTVAVEVGSAAVGPVVAVNDCVGAAPDQLERRKIADEGVSLESCLAHGVVQNQRRVRGGNDVAAERRSDERLP